MVSDDGFVIGQFTAATFNLLALGAVFGVVGSFTYLAVRPCLIGPPWLRSLTCAVAASVVLGSLLVAPDGVDFAELSPVALAVALFVAIPALFAALTVPLMEHALGPRGWARSAPAPLVVAPLAVFLFPPVLVVVGLPIALVLGARRAVARSRRLDAIARQPSAMRLARVAWAAIATFGLVLLTEDVLALRSSS
ncbi:MAG: hypothetical protein O3C25_00415 [Chloroflexi bacterium]|nr:hypothetical protein [Chloroflexota bacterium]